MTHNEIQDRLEAYHDRQLTEPGRREVEAHLGSCGSCREAVDRLAATSRAIFRPVYVSTTDFFVSRVMASIHESQGETPFGLFQGLWQWTALTLTVLAAFFIISAPSERPSPASRVCSTSNVLLAGSGARFESGERSTEPMDSLLDLPEEI